MSDKIELVETVSTRTTKDGKTISEVKKQQASGKNLGSAAAHNIVTIPVPKTHTINEFNPGRIRDTKGMHYSDVAGAFGTEVTRKNARFRIHELTRGPLSVEAEEEARIQAEVQHRLADELEAIREAVKQKAYQEGFELGRKDANAAVIEAAKPALTNFENMIATFEGVAPEIVRANEELLMRMVFWIARMVALKEINEDRDYTKRLILNILERLGTRENIKIHVGMEAYQAAEQLKSDLTQTLGQLRNVAIELDASIQDRGCRVETEFGEVDARIQVQLESVAKTFAANAEVIQKEPDGSGTPQA